MTKLPIISADACIKALLKLGFYVDPQRGSHIIMRRDKPFAQVVVPNHKEISRGTLRTIIRDIGLTVDEFTKYL